VIKKNTNPEWSEELTLSIEDPAQLHILSGCMIADKEYLLQQTMAQTQGDENPAGDNEDTMIP